MAAMIVNAVIKDGKLIIELPVEPKRSSTGKSTLVASTGGWQPSLAVHDGKPVTISVNAFIK